MFPLLAIGCQKSAAPFRYFEDEHCELQLFRIQHHIQLNDVIENNVGNLKRMRNRSLKTLGMELFTTTVELRFRKQLGQHAFVS